MVHSPLVFLYNALILYATLVLASLSKRRVFFFTIISIFWLGIGIINGVILTQRMTPFTVKDLSNLNDGLTIVTNYLSNYEIIGAIAAGLIAVGLLVLLFIKGPQKRDGVKRKRNLVAVLLVIAFTFLVVLLCDPGRHRTDFLRQPRLCLSGLWRGLLFCQYMAEHRHQ